VKLDLVWEVILSSLRFVPFWLFPLDAIKIMFRVLGSYLETRDSYLLPNIYRLMNNNVSVLEKLNTHCGSCNTSK
jgi:hypothetical protein